MQGPCKIGSPEFLLAERQNSACWVELRALVSGIHIMYIDIDR